MNRSSFHHILHEYESWKPEIKAVPINMQFSLRPSRSKPKHLSLEEISSQSHQLEIYYDLSYSYVSSSHPYLSEYESVSDSALSFVESIDMSDIYVGDSVGQDIYYTNPFISLNDSLNEK